MAFKSAHYVFEGEIKAEQPLATCSAALKEAEERVRGKNSPTPVPFINTAAGRRLMFPATGIRGKLRRALRDVLRENLILRTGNEKPLSLNEHYLLTLGGVKGGEATDKSSVSQEAEWRKNNVLLSLFGAGDAGFLGMVHGRLAVGNAICESVSSPVVFSGARTDDLYRDRGQIEFLSAADVEALIAQAEGNRDASAIKGQIRALDKERKAARAEKNADRVTQLTQEIERLEAEVKGVKEEAGVKNSVGMPLAGWEAIPAGAVMLQRFILNNASFEELGALLAALDQFSLMPTLGAHFAAGCGLVSARWEVFKVSPGVGKVSQGVLVLEPFSGALTVEAPQGSELFLARKAFQEYLGSEHFNLSVPSV
ncbi:CRISPR type IV/AFERR-associated protein Csf2 [Ectopseudomonas chengduensis]|uniref:CRISPR type IV/AFERR-associated protein Csf2 n=1 Tax=Ectopseudomonas chengduensis TaxID=489632 RepID=A0A1G6Q441_9GAMM|nr:MULTISPECIES: RAMP superfamily CRISPR-associated protein [Pseudomonas]MBP3062040.1 hypothetical protein [Pseudomonas chengduensis]NNB75332.1 hypothetical protein [Pseudomonas chengduensis]OEO24422.1 hypothetical protein AX279_17285 [Pseudomonas sp. J237]SDC86395.1 CRISPR type IV/AFERR-associated protein Csf2 [Pseudomonas chengduensis]